MQPGLPQKPYRALSPFLTGRVGVEDEHRLIGIAREQTGMIGGEGGAERRHRVGKPGLMQRNHIHIPFTEDELPPARGFGKIESEEVVGLFEHQRLARIQVFRFRIVEHPAPEGNHASPDIDDRDHHPVAEQVIEMVRIVPAPAAQPGSRQFLVVKSLFSQ